MDFMGTVCEVESTNGEKATRSHSHISGYRSAVTDLYKRKRVANNLVDSAKSFCTGFKRQVAQLKQSGDMPLTEGKQPINFEGYSFLTKIALSKEKEIPAAMAAHTFLCLSWNLMTRSVNTGLVMYNYLTWDGDSLVARIPHQKNDQDGAKSADPKHIYANPLEPHICPILSLAILAFSTSYRLDGSRALLFGPNAANNFSKWMIGVLREHKDELARSGHDISELGTHSFHKGVGTFLSGSPDGPNVVTIYLRAGWSLGPVQSRYLFTSKGGDQHVGRCACGLPPMDDNFATLPPHFGEYVLSEGVWNTVTGGAFHTNDGFKTVVPYLLASIVYHQDWLVRTLPTTHPLFFSRA